MQFCRGQQPLKCQVCVCLFFILVQLTKYFKRINTCYSTGTCKVFIESTLTLLNQPQQYYKNINTHSKGERVVFPCNLLCVVGTSQWSAQLYSMEKTQCLPQYLKANQPYTLVGSLKETPLAVKLLENQLYMSPPFTL